MTALSRTIANQSTRLFSQVRDSFNGQKCSDEEFRMRDRRNSGTYGMNAGSKGRSAARRDARRRCLPQSALRCTGEDHEGRGSAAAAAASRRRASRGDATRRRATVRPSRALVRVRTSTETRDPRHVTPTRCSGARLPFLLAPVTQSRPHEGTT